MQTTTIHNTAIDVRNNFETQQENLYKRIEAGRERNGNILDTIQNDGIMINDAIVNLGKSSPIHFTANGKVKMQIEEAEFTLHPNAIIQTGTKLGINPTFIKDLANSNEDWKRSLIANNLNEFVAHTDRNRVLVRTVSDEIRGVLSDSYKRYNSIELYNTFITQGNEMGLQVIDAHYDGLQGYIESVYPQVFPVETEKNGVMYYAFGARMRNSDFGLSPFELSLFMFQVVCYNGMVSTSAIHQRHLGRQLPEDVRLAQDTLIADTRAMNLIARDTINTVMRKQNIERKISEIQNASKTEVNLEQEFKSLVRKNQMNKTEVESLKKIVTNNRTVDGVQGENTLLKLSQAIGRVGSTNKDQVRKRELDELAYSLMTRRN